MEAQRRVSLALPCHALIPLPFCRNILVRPAVRAKQFVPCLSARVFYVSQSSSNRPGPRYDAASTSSSSGGYSYLFGERPGRLEHANFVNRQCWSRFAWLTVLCVLQAASDTDRTINSALSATCEFLSPANVHRVLLHLIISLKRRSFVSFRIWAAGVSTQRGITGNNARTLSLSSVGASQPEHSIAIFQQSFLSKFAGTGWPALPSRRR
jgi:hypothetical protein